MGFTNYLELYRSPYISKPFVASPKKNGIYKLFRALQICLHLQTICGIAYKEWDLQIIQSYIDLPTSPNHLWYRLQRRGFTNYLELYRSAYISKRFWDRLQRRGFINYLELYRSAYITIRIQHRLQRRSLSRIQSFIDLPTSPNHFWYRLTRRGFKNYLELCRSAYITIKFQHRLHRRSSSRIQSLIDLPPSSNHFWYRLQRRGFINYLELYRSAYITIRLQHRLQRRSLSRIQRFTDLPTSPNVFLELIAYKEGLQRFINYLELYRSAYITIGLQHRLQRSSLSRIQRFRDLPTSPNNF